MIIDMRILTGSYDRRDPENVVVELFGKSRDLRSVVVRYAGFRPYFYLVSPSPEIINKLANDDEVLDTKTVQLWHNGAVRDCLKVTIKHPWDVPKYKHEFQHECEVLAADIPFHHRFIYDFDLSSCIRVEGTEVTDAYRDNYNVDLVIDAKKISGTDDFKPALKILSFDIENSLERSEIFTIAATIKEKTTTESYHFEGTNKEILKNFIEFIKAKDPDVITGYNIEGYDIPYLLDRAKENNIAFHLGRDQASPQRISGRFWRVHGRIIADTWWHVRRELHLKQESLNAVAKELLNEEKLDVNRLLIDKEWATDREKVIKYCIRDSYLALKIFEKLGVLAKYMDIATVSKLPLGDVINSGSSTLIDSILIREADKHGVAVPLMKERRGEARIAGGYVHAIKPGLYHWVCVLDFKSMYPSIMIKYNICFTTIDPHGEIVSPTNVRFIKSDKKKGLIPQILENLMHKRDEIKRKMLSTTNAEERAHYNDVQQAIKILMNSFYGVFASSFYRFTNTYIGASITAFARETVKRIIKELESENIPVVYGDTDSIFFQSPYNNLRQTVEFGEMIATKFTEKEKLIFEFENVLEPFFSHGAKKRYVGKIVYPPSNRGKIIVRGYETRRSDSFDLQSEALMRIFEHILNDDIQGAKEESLKILERIRKGQVPPEKLVISKTTRDRKYYKNSRSLPNIQAYEKLKRIGEPVFPGMKVSWIVTNNKRTPQEVEPYVHGKEFKHTPDYEYYARRVAETLARVTEVFDLDQTQMLTGKKQTTLFDHEKKSKARSLDDFF